MNNEIEISPVYKSLTLEIEALTKEYSILWEERDRLINQTKPVLLVKYNLEIGQYILGYLNKHVYLLQLKRKIELLQIHINQNKPIEMKEIEKILDEEFREWIEKVSSLEREVRFARNSSFELVNEEKFKQVQEIYRKLVRQLHPDLNKELTDNQKILWNRIQEAYKNLDLEELTNLEILANGTNTVSEFSSLDVLTKRKESLWNKLQDLTNSLTAVKQSFPLSLEQELNDPNWLNKEVEVYQNKIKEIETILPEYEKMYQSILYQLYGAMGEHPENL
ncbi:MAG: hypothetical protein KBF93_12765 [Leptospiraceae bacterium]|nr:hypothetical protein [Leptospiraceae bacterium]